MEVRSDYDVQIVSLHGGKIQKVNNTVIWCSWWDYVAINRYGRVVLFQMLFVAVREPLTVIVIRDA